MKAKWLCSGAFVLTLAAGAQQTGRLTGIISTSKGSSAVGVFVTLMPLDGTDLPQTVFGRSDGTGKYFINSLPTGRYRVFFEGGPDKLPSSRYTFFQQATGLPVIVAVEPNRESTMNIQMPSYGYVTVSVMDSVTKSPVSKATCTFRKVSDPRTFFTASFPASGVLKQVLPQSPIEIVVEAPGYKSQLLTRPGGLTQVMPGAAEDLAFIAELTPTR